MSGFQAAGTTRRALALGVDAACTGGIIAVGYLLQIFDSTPMRPPSDWFWTEWLFKYWLDDRSVYWLPTLSWAVVAWAWYAAWTVATERGTPGARLLLLEVLDGDGLPPERGRLVVRSLLNAVNFLTLGFGWAWQLVTPNRRALHDLGSGTWTVKTPD